MNKTYAWINKTTYLIENVIMWDEVSPLAPPDNIQIAKIPDEVGACIGWAYANGEFIAPPSNNPVQTPIGGTPNVIA